MARKNQTEREIFRQFLQDCKPPELRPILQWAEEEVTVPSGPFEDFPFLADRLPYAKLLLNELGKWERHVITGPTQSGKSFHAFVLVIMYYLFERQEDVIAGIPDINMASDKWEEDIKPVIEKSSYANLLPIQGAGSKGAGKLQKIKFRNGRFLRFMSAGGNDKQRAGATARVLIVTETDGMDVVAESSQEGQTKIQQLEGRVRAHGSNAVKFFECTVSTESAFTWQNYNSGTASRIVHPCKSCGEYVSPDREHLVGWQDATDVIEAGENAHFTCPECGVHYSEEDRIEMNRQSMLVHRGQSVNLDGTIEGEPPKTKTLGFRWSAFQNLLYPTSKIGEEEWEAAKSEDPEIADIARKQQAWAIPAEKLNVEKVDISIDIIRGSHSDYRGRLLGIEAGVIPNGASVLTAGIDCSMRFLQWSIEAKVDKRIHVVDYGFYETPDHDIVTAEDAVERGLKELTKLLSDRFPALQMGLIDSGNWTERILQTTREIGGIWRASHGLPDYKHPAIRTPNKRLPLDGNRSWHESKNQGVWVINFNPDTHKHRVHSGFKVKPVIDGQYARGAITLPGSDPATHTTYAKQITAEEWRREFVKGKGLKEFWHKTRRDNHMLDVSVLCMVGRSIVAAANAQQITSRKLSDIAREKRER